MEARERALTAEFQFQLTERKIKRSLSFRFNQQQFVLLQSGRKSIFYW
jgi:hypothetical protein